MWVDAEGTPHTVALPDPYDVMSDSFRQSFTNLLDRHLDLLLNLLEEQECHALDAISAASWDTATEELHEGLTPPLKLLDGTLTDGADLAEAILSIELRWRLDAIMALQDIVP